MKKVILVLLGIVIIGLVSLLVYRIFDADEGKKTEKKVKTVQKIKGFGYLLEDRDTELYQTEFKILKINLEGKKIDYDAYAESISKMFIIDLYTLNNKVNKYDIGGQEFIAPEIADNYQLNVKDTLYKYIDDNSNGNRQQDLPEVATITIDSNEKENYKIKENKDNNIKEQTVDAYNIKLSWTYVEDLGYDSTGELILYQQDNKLVIIEKNELK